jgi:CBS-domain-containing membrane protein
VVKERAPTIGPDTYLEDLLNLSADSLEPIAVLDDDDQYRGMLSRSSILTALAGHSGIDEGELGGEASGQIETPEDTGATG